MSPKTHDEPVPVLNAAPAALPPSQPPPAPVEADRPPPPEPEKAKPVGELKVYSHSSLVYW